MPESSQHTRAEVGWCHPVIFTNPCHVRPSEPLVTHFISQKGSQSCRQPLCKHELQMGHLVQDTWVTSLASRVSLCWLSSLSQAVFFMVPRDSSRTWGLQRWE